MLTASQKKPQQNETARQLEGNLGDDVASEHGFRGVRRWLLADSSCNVMEHGDAREGK